MDHIFNKRIVTIKEQLLILVLIFQGCSSGVKKTQSYSSTPVLIESKIQTKDVSRSETNTATVQIVLLPNQAIRMEVTAILGLSVASVVMTPQKIQYALHRSKEYVQGPFSSKTLYPIFRQHLDPRLLWKVIHGQSPENSDLTCVKDNQQRPVSCLSKSMSVTVAWSYEEEGKRRIEIKNPQFELIWVFKSQTNLDTLQNETFVLKKPEDYKEIILK